MAKAKKALSITIPRIQEPSLLLMRLKELDEEFHRQTKQLAKVTKNFSKKLTDKL